MPPCDMSLVLTLALLFSGLISTVRTQGDTVYVWPDDSSLKYSGEGGNPGPAWGYPYPTMNGVYSNQSCDGGVRATNVSSASVELDFNGTNVWVWFLVDHVGSTASVYLDGGPPYPQSTNLDNVTSFADCRLVAYTSATLNEGPHNVTVVKSNDQPWLYFHGFQYMTSARPTSAVTESTSSTQGPQTTETERGSSDVGPIVGGVVGGIVFGILIAVAVGTFILRRRKRSEPYILDMRARAVDDSHSSQPPNSAGNTLSNPFTYQHISQVGLPLIAYPQASPSSSPATAQSPTSAAEKTQLRPSRQLPFPQPSAASAASAASATRTSELVAGRPMSSSQLDAVRTLVDRRVPNEVISSMIELMVAGQPIPNTIEELDHHQAAPSIESLPQYSADTRWP